MNSSFFNTKSPLRLEITPIHKWQNLNLWLIRRIFPMEISARLFVIHPSFFCYFGVIFLSGRDFPPPPKAVVHLNQYARQPGCIGTRDVAACMLQGCVRIVLLDFLWRSSTFLSIVSPWWRFAHVLALIRFVHFDSAEGCDFEGCQRTRKEGILMSAPPPLTKALICSKASLR